MGNIMSVSYTHLDVYKRQVMICDWHYERPDPTAVYFAMKGFDVATSPWRNTPIALQQKQMMLDLRAHATPEMKPRFTGMVQTVWSGAGGFLDKFYTDSEEDSDAKCFKALFANE